VSVPRIVRTLIGLVLAPIAWLLAATVCARIPPALLTEESHEEAIHFTDRDGIALRDVRASDGQRAIWVHGEDLGGTFLPALVAAEDKRFYSHAGVDWVAMVRAAISDLKAFHIVSGGSTLTMQLARNVAPHPRKSFLAKAQEMALAMRIEVALTKTQIAEQYANRAPFGEGIRGAAAASVYYFDKPLRLLSWAEAATLASLPKGPHVYAPEKHRERLLARRHFVLGRLRADGIIDAETYARADSEPLTLQLKKGTFGAPHLVDGLLLGRIAPEVPSVRRNAQWVTTTIDREIQHVAETRVREVTDRLRLKHVTAAAAVVLDNESGEILAYVGSPAFFDEERKGANDGVLQMRQPGSALKPFVYGLAMETLHFGAETALPDVEQSFFSEAGEFLPKNYDEKTHGPVRLREALANSLNIPAVYTADRVGVARLQERFHDLGMNLSAQDLHYGPAIALGDGEVRLIDLANAYATLARGGVWKPAKSVKSIRDTSGAEAFPEWRESKRVMPPRVAWMLTDVLQDRRARISAFGERNVLELPFDVAVKTGTSKGFRDNWAVGYTKSRTVAIWVGNFDGSSMEGISGISGAGPLFHDIMIAAMEGQEVGFPPPPEGIEKRRICLLSGMEPTGACTHIGEEWKFSEAPGTSECSMHVRTKVDRSNGLLANTERGGCAPGDAEERSFERFEGVYKEWARAQHRPQVPTEWSPRCDRGAVERATASSHLAIVYPRDGARFVIDPARPPASQALNVRVDSGGSRVVLKVDGRAVDSRPGGEELVWRLSRGAHILTAETDHTESAPRTVYVD